MQVIFYDKLSWFVYELPEKDISNFVIQCRYYSTVSCRGLCLNHSKMITRT